MSHTSEIETKMTNLQALRDACTALGLAAPVENADVRLFDGTHVQGTSVKLPGWNYPVVFQADGTAKFDNYNGAWGKMKHFNDFRQQYTLAVVKRTMGRNHKVETVAQPDGSLRVVLSR